MKIYIVPNYIHQMNLKSLLLCIDFNKWQCVDNIFDADIIYSPSEPINIQYKEKLYIFGPHFSVFPDSKIASIDNKFNNAIYIQPSLWPISLWKDDFNYNFIPILPYAFCIDELKYNESNKEKSEIFIYLKNRNMDEINFVLDYLNKIGIKYTIINYGNYNEDDFIELLGKSKYGIWIGSHESQGFALECALSCGVPLLVWNVSKLCQETGCPAIYYSAKTIATSIPYWDTRCGEYFYDKEQFIETFEKFLSKLDQYKPRNFILETLSTKIRANALADLVKINQHETKLPQTET